MPRRFGLEYRFGLTEAAAPARPRTSDLVAVATLLSNIWCGAVRIGLSLVWDSPEKSWYRRVPP